MKKAITVSILSISIIAHLANAQATVNRVNFSNLGDGDNWIDQENWENRTVPGITDVVRIHNGFTARLTTEETVTGIQPGADGRGELIIDGGKLTVTGHINNGWSIVGYNSKGSLTIENNGSLTAQDWLSVGRTGNGELTIHEGTVRVENIFFHHIDQTIPQDYLASRTTLYPGGLLDVDQIILNAGVMDIAGGTLIVREYALATIEQYVMDGRIIAMGGEAGWKVQTSFNPSTGWTAVVAVPGEGQEPVLVEMQSTDLSSPSPEEEQSIDPSLPVPVRQIRFIDRNGEGSWESPSNWAGDTIPGINDVAIFNNGKTASLTTPATVLAIRPGADGPGGLIVDGGTLSVIGEGNEEWSIVGYSHNGSLTVQNGGSITFKKWFSVGRFGAGTLTIYEGTVRVDNQFRHHSLGEGADKNLATRTTLYPGALLDANDLILNAGVLDIAGGMLIVRMNVLATIEQYVDDGRIIAMDGKAGWKIQTSLDSDTGWTTVVAVPDNSVPVDEQMPISVGMQTPNCIHIKKDYT